MWCFGAGVCSGAAGAGRAPGEAGKDVDHFGVLGLVNWTGGDGVYVL